MKPPAPVTRTRLLEGFAAVVNPCIAAPPTRRGYPRGPACRSGGSFPVVPYVGFHLFGFAMESGRALNYKEYLRDHTKVTQTGREPPLPGRRSPLRSAEAGPRRPPAPRPPRTRRRDDRIARRCHGSEPAARGSST